MKLPQNFEQHYQVEKAILAQKRKQQTISQPKIQSHEKSRF